MVMTNIKRKTLSIQIHILDFSVRAAY